jgi:hypothetical protein
VKIDIDKSGVVIRCRQPDWKSAALHIVEYRISPPNGYKLIRGTVARRTRSGAATNLTLDFEYCDTRVEAFTTNEAFDFFRELEPHKGPWVPDAVEDTR